MRRATPLVGDEVEPYCRGLEAASMELLRMRNACTTAGVTRGAGRPRKGTARPQPFASDVAVVTFGQRTVTRFVAVVRDLGHERYAMFSAIIHLYSPGQEARRHSHHDRFIGREAPRREGIRDKRTIRRSKRPRPRDLNRGDCLCSGPAAPRIGSKSGIPYPFRRAPS